MTNTESTVHVIYLIPTQHFNQLLDRSICMPLCMGTLSSIPP